MKKAEVQCLHSTRQTFLNCADSKNIHKNQPLMKTKTIRIPITRSSTYGDFLADLDATMKGPRSKQHATFHDEAAALARPARIRITF
ncbi:hypothetical protein PQQ81_10865 [Paraburkholderia strydomiana]|uniref:hypothetical protein n=1 Tax=Paraburkholderia strydomiana TaxID=1245417 RepID=UPI0038BBA036